MLTWESKGLLKCLPDNVYLPSGKQCVLTIKQTVCTHHQVGCHQILLVLSKEELHLLLIWWHFEYPSPTPHLMWYEKDI